MPAIDEIKEQETTPTPLFLFECTLPDGSIERWGTHAAAFDGQAYAARLLRHNLFELGGSPEETKISLTLANADSRFSEIEREVGFRGGRLTIRFLFYDLAAQQAASEARVVFLGIGNAAEEMTEATLRVTFNNRLNLQRIVLPEVRIQRRCPWLFPATAVQRQEALNGGAKGKYSALHRCGYSADQTEGEGTLDGAMPFTSCDYTRANCSARGMFDLKRFGGIEFVPAQIEVRSFGEPGSHLSPIVANEARYNDFVPLVYGTAWYQPPVVFARNDGNLTHLEVLLGLSGFYLVRGELHTALTLGEECRSLAQRLSHAAGLLSTYRRLGITCLHGGAFVQAREHFAQGLRLYNPSRPPRAPCHA